MYNQTFNSNLKYFWQDLNLEPSQLQSGALSIELLRLIKTPSYNNNIKREVESIKNFTSVVSGLDTYS